MDARDVGNFTFTVLPGAHFSTSAHTGLESLFSIAV